MDELIQQLTSKLGIDESVAGGATSKAMAILARSDSRARRRLLSGMQWCL